MPRRSSSLSRNGLRVAIAAGLALVVTACVNPSAQSSSAPQRTLVASVGKPPVYLHYYLWWTPQHWQDKLGLSYPYTSSPLAVPGALGVDGCHASVTYPGASIVDIPSDGLADQSDPATLDRDIATAAGAGVRGFVVSWQGAGAPGQTPASSGYNARLDLLVSRVNAYNAGHPRPFTLALGMSAYGNYARPASAITADLQYFVSQYAGNPAFANDFSARPLAMLLASRKYTAGQIPVVAAAVRNQVLLISDDTNASWSSTQQNFDGASWYWSSQNPDANPQSGSQVQSLAGQVHAAHKLFFAPFAPGFNAQLNGGSACTPRKGTDTLAAIWTLNQPSQPDAWFGISWNEYVENTYLQPSRSYGTAELDRLRQLIAAQ